MTKWPPSLITAGLNTPADSKPPPCGVRMGWRESRFQGPKGGVNLKPSADNKSATPASSKRNLARREVIGQLLVEPAAFEGVEPNPAAVRAARPGKRHWSTRSQLHWPRSRPKPWFHPIGSRRCIFRGWCHRGENSHPPWRGIYN